VLKTIIRERFTSLTPLRPADPMDTVDAREALPIP
jgi:hypothetical protein